MHTGCKTLMDDVASVTQVASCVWLYLELPPFLLQLLVLLVELPPVLLQPLVMLPNLRLPERLCGDGAGADGGDVEPRFLAGG